jgi:hypothetical protein
LESFNKYLDIGTLTITSTLTAVVLFKLKFRLDKAAYVIITIYLMSMALRVIQNQISIPNHPLMSIMWPLASNLIFGIQYFFVFEMIKVQANIQSNSPYEKEIQMKKIERESLWIKIVYAVDITHAIVLQYFFNTKIEIVRANPWIFIYLAIQSRIIKTGLFIYMAIKLIRTLKYFIAEKVDAMMRRS